MKIDFLSEIQEVRDIHVGPWLMVRGFNIIVDAANKMNVNLNQRMKAPFHRLLNLFELKELYLNGRRNTCTHEHQHATLENLDRVFATSS